MDNITAAATPSPSSAHKRTVRQRDEEEAAQPDAEHGEQEDQRSSLFAFDNHHSTPPKRQRNGQGNPIARGRTLKYNARILLNHLAFTRLYVTANFRRYDPALSPVVLVFVSPSSVGQGHGDRLYHALS